MIKPNVFNIVFAVTMIIFSPFLIIWALNTLFSLVISFTFKNWVAAVVLLLIFQGEGLKARF